MACGPGLVACEVAKVARHVTGIDLTPAMIEQARGRQQSLGLANLTWVRRRRPAAAVPGRERSPGSSPATRSTTSPTRQGVFAEMVRVCRPGGRVTVCDVFTTSAEQAEVYDRLERYRDPSHTHALQLAELDALFAGLTDVRREFYRYPVKVEAICCRGRSLIKDLVLYLQNPDRAPATDQTGVVADQQPNSSAEKLHYKTPFGFMFTSDGLSAISLRGRHLPPTT